MNRRIDAAGAAFFTLLGAAGVIAALSLNPTENLRDPLTAKGMPLAISLFIVVIAGGIMVRQLLKLRAGADLMAVSEGKEDLADHPSSFRRVLLIWASVLAYALGMLLIGYLFASFLAAMALLRLMEVTSWRTVLVVAGLYAVVTWGFFGQVMDVNLPTVIGWV